MEFSIVKETDKQMSEVSSEENNEAVESELLKKLPPEAKKIFAMMATQRSGLITNPITHKINEKHIDKILEIADKDDDRSFNDAVETRKYALIYFIIFAGLFVFSTVFLVSHDKELYKEVIKLFAVFLGGLGSGFGFKSYLDRNR